VQRPLQDRKVVPTLVSIAGHLLVATIVAVPVLYITNALPPVPDMMAFVAEPPPPSVPPPPALPRPAASAVTRMVTPATPTPRGPAPPVDASPAIAQEADVPQTTDSAGEEGGIEGGVESGVASGSVGGLVGGKLAAEPPFAPLPPALPPAGPVRIGALIKAPELVHKVQPAYPDIAVAAQLEGVVILEATVGADGQVDSVRVLTSQNHLLDMAAVAAVKQWRYAPLLLNGTPAAFVLTVTVEFSLRRKP
jgi:periplasmic protein TonB